MEKTQVRRPTRHLEFWKLKNNKINRTRTIIER